MTTDSTSAVDPRLQFYYFGLYTVLKRYRRCAIIGWVVVAAGCGGLLRGWNLGQMHGLFDIGLALLTILAGVLLVHFGVVTLSAYTSLRLPDAGTQGFSGTSGRAIEEIKTLLDDLDRGGWQEAFAAINQLVTMSQRYGLPPLDEDSPVHEKKGEQDG
jgi:hypothetical protein